MNYKYYISSLLLSAFFSIHAMDVHEIKHFKHAVEILQNYEKTGSTTLTIQAIQELSNPNHPHFIAKHTNNQFYLQFHQIDLIPILNDYQGPEQTPNNKDNPACLIDIQLQFLPHNKSIRYTATQIADDEKIYNALYHPTLIPRSISKSVLERQMAFASPEKQQKAKQTIGLINLLENTKTYSLQNKDFKAVIDSIKQSKRKITDGDIQNLSQSAPIPDEQSVPSEIENNLIIKTPEQPIETQTDAAILIDDQVPQETIKDKPDQNDIAQRTQMQQPTDNLQMLDQTPTTQQQQISEEPQDITKNNPQPTLPAIDVKDRPDQDNTTEQTKQPADDLQKSDPVPTAQQQQISQEHQIKDVTPEKTSAAPTTQQLNSETPAAKPQKEKKASITPFYKRPLFFGGLTIFGLIALYCHKHYGEFFTNGFSYNASNVIAYFEKAVTTLLKSSKAEIPS